MIEPDIIIDDGGDLVHLLHTSRRELILYIKGGAGVIITEIDSIKAAEVVMDGFKVMPMIDAARLGEIFITATGCRNVITGEHYKVMKDGVILCNAGHFDVEVSVSVSDLEKMAVKKEEQRRNIMGYLMPDGRWLNLLAEGRLVNLAAGDGHPAEIMDMSFALQALCAEYVLLNSGKLGTRVMDVPDEIDKRVARMKLDAWETKIDRLTEEQRVYLGSWNDSMFSHPDLF